MALTQFTKFNEVVDSFNLRHAMAGILSPGRYVGFSSGVNTAGMNFTIGHGIVHGKVAKNGTIDFTYGVFVMGTGQIYHESDSVNIVLDPETLGSVRYDALVARVDYTTNGAGDTPDYIIKKGLVSNPLDPYLAINNDGISPNEALLGVFTIPADASVGDDVIYTPNYLTVFQGSQTIGNIFASDILRKPIETEIVTPFFNKVIDIDDAMLDGGNSVNLAINQRMALFNNKIIRVKGYTGLSDGITVFYPGSFNVNKIPYKFTFLWDEKPISVLKNGGTLDTYIEEDYNQTNEAQYTTFTLTNLTDGVHRITGEMQWLCEGRLAPIS